MKHVIVFVFALLLSGPAISDPFTYEFHEVSPGVWVGIRDNSPRFPVMGTTTFVVSEEGVVVFDGGGVPRMSELAIEKIRKVTDKPVTHVVISHWHGDHNLGIYRFLEEYPNVQLVGHTFTRAAMLGSPMSYVDGYPEFVAKTKPRFEEALEKGGSAEQEAWRRQMLADADLIDKEYHRVKVTPPTMTFDDKLAIYSGSRVIELMYLGDANTAGDIVMWLPAERVAATGDIVVHPTPYGFNVPPKAWAETMRRLIALDYKVLVPGHGDIQRDTVYVDLLIETAESIAAQRDALLAMGLTPEEAEEKLDFSHVEERFTGGDAFLANRWDSWFEGPFRKAVFKALTNEPMVSIKPKEMKKAEDDG